MPLCILIYLRESVQNTSAQWSASSSLCILRSLGAYFSRLLLCHYPKERRVMRLREGLIARVCIKLNATQLTSLFATGGILLQIEMAKRPSVLRPARSSQQRYVCGAIIDPISTFSESTQALAETLQVGVHVQQWQIYEYVLCRESRWLARYNW